MTRNDFWKSDWFLGVAVAVVVLVISRTDFVQSMERKAYDLGVRASNRMPSDRIAVIAFDDNSVANIGRWPGPRDLHDGATRTEPLLLASVDQKTQERFATGDQMAKAIRQCTESFGAVDVAL